MRTRHEFQSCCMCMQRLIKQGVHRRAARQYKNAIKEAKRKSWETFVRDTINEDPYSLAYRLGADKIKTKEIFNTVEINTTHTTDNLGTMRAFMHSLVPLDLGPDRDSPEQNAIRQKHGSTESHNLELLFS